MTAAAAGQPGSPGLRGLRGPLLVVLLLAASVYANTLGHGFVHDDNLQVLNNPLITSWDHLPEILTGDVHAFRASSREAVYYRPAMLVFYLALHTTFGPSPLAFHLASVLLHAAGSVLVLLLGLRLVGDRPVALLGALLFATHPIHVEVAAWVGAVPDGLVLPFAASAFLAATRGSAKGPGAAWLGLSAALTLGGLLAKETAVVIPVLIAVYQVAVKRHGWWRALPAAAMVPVYLALRQHAVGTLVVARQASLGPVASLLSVPAVLWEYARILLVPWPLNMYRVFHPPTSPLDGRVVLGALLLAGGLAWLAVRRDRWSFLLAWTTLAIGPAYYVRALGENAIAERYAHLASVGYCLLLAGALRAVPRPAVRLGLASLVVLVFSTLTFHRNRVWADDIALYGDTVARAPEVFSLRNDLAAAYGREGLLDRAAAELERARALQPSAWQVALNLGNVYLVSGRRDRALESYREAARLAPGVADTRLNYGIALRESGQLDRALLELREATRLNPRLPQAWLSLGIAFERSGDAGQAAACYRRTLELVPGHRDATRRLGSLRETSPSPSP